MTGLKLTGWGCINWHNLATKNISLPGGDVFNVGKMESGKTTWLDAVQLVLTGGEGMEWNSAANPALTRNQLQEKGRGIRGILYRENDGQPLTDSEKPAISYFLIELQDEKATVTLGVGAYASSYKARPEVWWILAPGKSLNAVRCTNSSDKPLPLDAFREANGAIAYRHGKDYRVRLAYILFSSLMAVDDADRHERAALLMEQWQRYLNSAKSYGRLRGQRESELIRRALRAPDEAALQKARQTIDEISRLQANIAEAERQVAQMKNIGTLVTKVHNLTKQALEEDLAEQVILHRDAAQAMRDADTDASRAEAAVASLDAKAKALAGELTATNQLLDTLRSSDIGRKAERAAQLEGEVAEARKKLNGAVQLLEDRRKALAILQGKLDDATKVLADAARTAIARLSQLSERAPAVAKPALGRIEDTVRRAAYDDVQIAYDDAQDAMREAQQGHRDRAQEAQLQFDFANARAKQLDGELNQLLARQMPLADAALIDALVGLEGKAIIAHQTLEVRRGHDIEASLLEQYLPRSVLAAVIPLEEKDTDLVRRRIHTRYPHLKVVDRHELAPNVQLGGALACLDAEMSHPLAVQYLAAAYGDVGLLEPGDDRDGRERVIWRDGNVYDGVAWTLQDPKGPGRFLGQAAMAEAHRRDVEGKRAELAAANKEASKNDEARKAEHKSAAHLKQLSIDLGNFVGPTNLVRLHGEVRVATERSNNGKISFDETQVQHDSEKQAHDLLAKQLAELRRAVADKAARGILDQIADATKRISQARDQEKEVLTSKGIELGKVQSARSRYKQVEQAVNDLVGKLAAARRAYMDFAGVGLAETTAVEQGYQETALKTIEGRRRNTLPDRATAQANIVTACLAIEPQRALFYDHERNVVKETATGEPLDRALATLSTETESKRKTNTQRMSELTRQQIVVPIVQGIHDDLGDLDRLQREMNALLASTPINGKHYQIRKNRAQGADQALLNLLRNYNAANPEPVLDAIKVRLQEAGSDIAAVFDYRNWFDFRLARVRKGIQVSDDGDDSDADLLANHQEKGSGGAQAAPHYVLVYVLMRVFYDSAVSRLRLVLLDEAFRGIDTGHQQDLIHIGKELGLTLLAANTELRGHETRRDTSTMQIFMQDPESSYTQVKPVIQKAA